MSGPSARSQFQMADAQTYDDWRDATEWKVCDDDACLVEMDESEFNKCA